MSLYNPGVGTDTNGAVRMRVCFLGEKRPEEQGSDTKDQKFRNGSPV